MGVQSRDVVGLLGSAESDDLLRLSVRDRKKAMKMLENNIVLEEDGEEELWRRELQVMLMLSMKAEMELLAEKEGGVEAWVEEKLLSNQQ